MRLSGVCTPVLTWCLLLIACQAATYTCVGLGTWSNPTAWMGGNVPVNDETDIVYLLGGCSVRLTEDVILGELHISSGAQLDLCESGSTFHALHVSTLLNMSSGAALISDVNPVVLDPLVVVSVGDHGDGLGRIVSSGAPSSVTIRNVRLEASEDCSVVGFLVLTNSYLSCRRLVVPPSPVLLTEIFLGSTLHVEDTIDIADGHRLTLFTTSGASMGATQVVLPDNATLAIGKPGLSQSCPQQVFQSHFNVTGRGSVMLYGCEYTLDRPMPDVMLELIGGMYSFVNTSVTSFRAMNTVRDGTHGSVVLRNDVGGRNGVVVISEFVTSAELAIRGLTVRMGLLQLTSTVRLGQTTLELLAGNHYVTVTSNLMSDYNPGASQNYVVNYGVVHMEEDITLQVFRDVCFRNAGAGNVVGGSFVDLGTCGPSSSSVPRSSSSSSFRRSSSSSSFFSGGVSSSSASSLSSTSEGSGGGHPSSSSSSGDGGGAGESSGGKGGAVAGAVIGVLLGVGLLVAGVWYFRRRAREEGGFRGVKRRAAREEGAPGGPRSSTSAFQSNTGGGGMHTARNKIGVQLGLKAQHTFSLMRGTASAEAIAFEDIKLMKEVGSGFSSVVHKALWHGTEVALKLLRAQDKRGVEELEAEMRMALVIGAHPRVVNFLGACVNTPHLGLVLDFMPYGSIEQYLRTKACVLDLPTSNDDERELFLQSLRKLTQMAQDASAALLHCHSKAVVHRDIAARNFLIDHKQRVHISDFGISVVLLQASDSFQGDPAEMLPIKWCAPETLRKREFSQKTDVYSFGVFLWELLAQSVPYPDENISSVAANVAIPAKLPYRPAVPGFCPVELASLLKSCWEEEAKARPTMHEVNLALLQFRQTIDFRESNAMVLDRSSAAVPSTNSLTNASHHSTYAKASEFPRVYRALDGVSLNRKSATVPLVRDSTATSSGDSEGHSDYAIYQYPGAAAALLQ